MAARLRATLGRDPLTSTPVTALLAAVLAAVTGLMVVKLGGPQHQLKAGLAVVALVVLVVAALKPVFGLALVVALLPFEYSVVGVGTDEGLILGVGAILLWRVEARRVPPWILLASAGLVFGSLLTVLNAHNQHSAVWGALRWLGVLVLLAETFSLLHDRPDAPRRLVDILTTVGMVVVFFGLLQKAGIYMLVGAPYQSGNIDSFFSYYTNYGGYVAVLAVLATGELLGALAARQTSRALVYGPAVVWLLLGIAISASRGALLALGAGWAFLLVLNFRRGSLIARALALIAVLALAGYAATPAQTRVRILNRFSSPLGSQTEDQQRFALQRLGLQALERNPLGIGFENFRFYLANHPTTGANQIFFHSHRLPVQIGLDAGWLGLAGFVLLFFGSMVMAVRAGPRSRVRNVAFAAALGGLMAQGLFDYVFYDLSLVALFAALVWGAVNRAESSGPRAIAEAR